MNFELNEDRRMLSDTIERFLGDNYGIEKRHEITSGDDGYSKEIWNRFAELGIIGALFGEDVGGFGGTGIDIAVVFEQLGRGLVVEPFLANLLAGNILAAIGNDSQKAILETVISGTDMLALAHGEPLARYELASVSSTAKHDGDNWFVSGDKCVVNGGGNATHLVVSARTGGETEDENGISLFLIDAGAGGIRNRSYATVDGYNAADIHFDKVHAELVGEPGKGFAAIEKAHAIGITAICAEALGAMEVAKDLTVEYMHTRKQFGVPIGKFQALQHRMADVLIELEQMRSAVINVAARLNDDRITRERNVSSAKYLAGRIGRQVAEEAVQIHGGMGMTWEYPVGHYAKRITMIDHLFGDTDHHLERYIALGRK